MRRLFPLILIFAIFLSGCGREIDDTAYVVAIGVDKGVETYDFTFAIANPNNVGGDDGKGDSLIFVSASGEDVFTAGETVGSLLGQKVNFSHSEVIVFSTAVAEEGVCVLSSSLIRSLSQRPKIIPAIALASARETIEAISPHIENNPERYLTKLFEGRENSFIQPMDNRQFLARMKSERRGAVIPCIAVADDGIKINSVAFMQGDKVAGFTEDMYSSALVMGDGGTISYPVSGGSLRLNQSTNPKITVECAESPVINIKIPLAASLQTLSPGMSRETMTDICEKEIAGNIRSILEYTSHLGADVFAIDRYAGKEFLTTDAFAAYGWADKYKKAAFNVSVEISSSGTSLMKGEG